MTSNRNWKTVAQQIQFMERQRGANITFPNYLSCRICGFFDMSEQETIDIITERRPHQVKRTISEGACNPGRKAHKELNWPSFEPVEERAPDDPPSSKLL